MGCLWATNRWRCQKCLQYVLNHLTTGCIHLTEKKKLLILIISLHISQIKTNIYFCLLFKKGSVQQENQKNTLLNRDKTLIIPTQLYCFVQAEQRALSQSYSSFISQNQNELVWQIYGRNEEYICYASSFNVELWMVDENAWL